MSKLSPKQVPEYQHPLQSFQKLMPNRVRRLLLIASRYDSFLLGEDGRLQDFFLTESLDLALGGEPWLTRVSSAERALAAVDRGRFDLVVMTDHVRDMPSTELVGKLKRIAPYLPIVPLAFDDRELTKIKASENRELCERPFMWQGDFRLLPAIMQWIEDRWNVADDTERVGVSVVILVEDSESYYSSFLPMLYSELRDQSQRVIVEGTNLQNKIMRLRARPKILHCTSFEEALARYDQYQEYVVGIITDVSFPKQGKITAMAGIELARQIRSERPDLPILLQTNDETALSRIDDLGAEIVQKRSSRLLRQVSEFIHHNFGFGDFVFRLENGKEVGRAKDLPSLVQQLRTVTADSVLYHARREHFSTWLRARTEFSLANRIGQYSAEEFEDAEEIRRFVLKSIQEFRRDRQSDIVADFDRGDFHKRTGFAQIGDGSLGGKARGLAFVRKLLANYRVRNQFPEVEVSVPCSVVLATGVFDQFLDENNLRPFALDECDDRLIQQRFADAKLPANVVESLRDFLEIADFPLAVRSSSLLEDSQYVPFTGVYATYMIPNASPHLPRRLERLTRAIKQVYASTFSQRAKEYIAPTSYRLEEEKMAVLVQRLLGRRHGPRFYPDFSGVARSYNFYPVKPMRPDDGIVLMALGLGETVVEGGNAVAFCPTYPRHPIHFSSPDDILKHAQREFFALDLNQSDDGHVNLELNKYDLETARQDGTLDRTGSIYCPDNHAIYDGVGRDGIPLVTFSQILKHGLFPIADLSTLLLQVGTRAMNRPVEIEFAVNLQNGEQRAEFAFLQMRPFVLRYEEENVSIKELDPSSLLCASTMVLGSGRIEDIHDIVFVDRDKYDRALSRDYASQVALINGKLAAARRPYLLVGVGRWGASDPWLGIPITWEQISTARVIVETGFRDFDVVPSQGSHFFQNLSSAGVGYFTVSKEDSSNFVDWAWLHEQPAVESTNAVRHIRLDKPVVVRMDGKKGCGVIAKPTIDDHD